MLDRPMRIFQVSTTDIGGGAEKIALNLFQSYRARGFDSWLAVGDKRGDDPNVLPIPKRDPSGRWSEILLTLEKQLQPYEGNRRAISRARTLLRTVAHPRRELEARFGIEDFNYPGTRRLLQLPPRAPDVVHCHNLHGGYFDLREISWLSRQVPLVFTLHDAWLMSGHCAHSFDCERWKTGCGRCPDLSIYPAIGRDATAFNWRRKKNIFSRSAVYVSTPSKWLMQKVQLSLLSRSIKDTRVIPNGVDLSVFYPADKRSVRSVLGLPQDKIILLFAAYRATTNIFKDYKTMRAAMVRVSQIWKQPLLFLSLGGDAETETIGETELRVMPYQTDTKTVARYYQAADIYVHASHVDTFPCSVLEALACATPVIATEVGGIPEQIKGLRGFNIHAAESNRYASSDATGILVPAGDSEAMAESIRRLLNDDALRRQLSRNACKDARERFDLEQQADRYIDWYEELIGDAVASKARLTSVIDDNR